MHERLGPHKPCEAPEHVDGCSGHGSTEDHFTPKCIAKKLGWSQKTINSPENLQYLSPECHREKDATTPQRLQEFIYQQNGGSIFFGEHTQLDMTKRGKAERAELLASGDLTPGIAVDIAIARTREPGI